MLSDTVLQISDAIRHLLPHGGIFLGIADSHIYVIKVYKDFYEYKIEL